MNKQYLMTGITRLSMIGFGTVAMIAGGSTLSVAEPETHKVTLENVGNTTTVGGTVIPYKEVTLAAQIAGEVKFVGGVEGDEFKIGDRLISIDDAQVQARRRAAVAAYMAAQSTMRNARMQYSRELWSPRTGKPTGMGMPSMFDSMMKPFMGQQAGPYNPWVGRYADLYGQARGVEQAQSSIMQAKAEIELLDAKIRDAHMQAPFKGKIIQKMVEVGDTVQPGQPLLKFAFVDFLRIQAEVPVRIMDSLNVGDDVSAKLDIGKEGIYVPARIAQIFPVADAARHTVTVKFDLQKGTPGAPGAYAEVRLVETGSSVKSLPSVPETAIFRRGSLSAVKILKNGKEELRLVRQGSKIGRGLVSILSGLYEGDLVIVKPEERLRAMRIRGENSGG